MKFEWDLAKEKINIKKHGITFNEATSIFYSSETKLFVDPDHSEEEERFIALGQSDGFRVLIVVHCYRENDEIVRVISARKADKSEREQYFKGEKR